MALPLNRILEEALALSLEDQARLREELSRLAPTQPKNPEAARALCGKYAHAPTSSEEFCARKAEDLPLEEHSRK